MDSARSDRTLGWIAVGCFAALLGAWLLFGRAAEPAPVAVAREPRADGPGTRRLNVHVAGAVRRPGLYRLAPGSRAGDAVRRAGGPTRRADLAAVNLAAPLEDGQQVIVPARPSVAEVSGAGPGPAAADGSAGPLRLSTATVEQLDELDGIGPALAERIVEFRTRNGGIRSVEELAEVEGIGDARLATLREAAVP